MTNALKRLSTLGIGSGENERMVAELEDRELWRPWPNNMAKRGDRSHAQTSNKRLAHYPPPTLDSRVRQGPNQTPMILPESLTYSLKQLKGGNMSYKNCFPGTYHQAAESKPDSQDRICPQDFSKQRRYVRQGHIILQEVVTMSIGYVFSQRDW